jgi:hypothetical protein
MFLRERKNGKVEKEIEKDCEKSDEESPKVVVYRSWIFETENQNIFCDN